MSSGSGPAAAERCYRALLLLLPPAFRRRHGEEMVRFLRDQSRPGIARPGRGPWRALLPAALDLLRIAPALWLDVFRHGTDLRHAIRGLRRAPGHAIAAGLTLALGIGANTALFSVIDAVLLRPLPYREPDRLVALWDTLPAQGRDHEPPSPGNFLDWQAKNRTFESMAAWMDGSGTSTLHGEREAAVVESVEVTPEFFRVMGVAPALGRTFAPGERGAFFNVANRYTGGDRVAMMSHALWTRRFGADPAVVGRLIDVDGAPWRVIGVMPEGFDAPRPTTDLWLPWDIVPSFAEFKAGPPRDYRFLNVLGRLKPRIGASQAESDLQALAAALADQHPKENAGWSVRVIPLGEEIVGRARPVIFALFGAVGLVLLIACANVASLQLARASSRRREMAVRLALGAPRRRLVGQLLVESLLLGLLGGTAGLLVAAGALRAILTAEPEGLPRLAAVALGGRVLAFSAVLSLLTGALFGLVPALEASRTPVAGALQENGRTTSAGPRARRARRFLIVSEVALALVLLTGAGLLIRSFLRVMAVDPGFDPQSVAVMRINLDQATYKTAAHSREFYRALLARLETLPGVTAAGAVTALPLSPVGTDFSRPYWREGEADPGGTAAKADIRMVTPGYFNTMRMALRRGRGFTADDGPDRPRIIVVNETLARRAFPGRDPVGQRLVIDYRGGAYPYEIVGVVGDTRFRGLKAEPRPELFIPHAQNPYLGLSLVVRTSSDPAAMLRRVQREIAAVDPLQPAYGLVTMDDLVRRSVAADRFATVLLGLLAGLALALAATGIYGVLSFLVAQRTHEIGLRMALGATRRAVVRMVMGESLRLTLAGCGIGLLASLGLARAAAGLLYEVRPDDPATLGGVVALMAGVALLAALVPAHRASRLDPLVALRQD
ncbi:MAG: hypothetical protein DMF82_02240 [Acidobacteria bacterium]|nr:MAG: hypothetical protein DMF82_02240 [Acidobacteriota bacterium]